MEMRLVLNLVASVGEDRDMAYAALESIGVDRKTADAMAAEFY